MRLNTRLISFLIFSGMITLSTNSFAQKRAHFQHGLHAQQKQELLPFKIMQRSQTADNTAIRKFHKPQENTVLSEHTSEMNSRLIALTDASFDGVFFTPYDSARFYYSGTNHDPYLTNLFLDNLLYYPDNTFKAPVIDYSIDFSTDSIYQFYWDEGADVYETHSKLIMALDNDGNVASTTVLETQDGVNWTILSRSLYTYDNNGNKLTEIRQDYSGSVWENNYRNKFSYDSQNNLTEASSYQWHVNTSSWKETVRSVAGYEGPNQMSYLIKQHWNSSENEWGNSYRYTYQFSGDNISELIESMWNETQSSWSEMWKTVNTYNANNQLTLSQEYSWHSANQEWQNMEKRIYTYDDSGNNIKFNIQGWSSGSWVHEYQEDYAYSSDNALTEVVGSDWMGASFEPHGRILYTNNSHGQVTQMESQVWDGNDFATQIYDTKVNLYYEEFEGGTTGIQEVLNRTEFEIYPNPASDHLNIKLDGKDIQQIRIIDVSGRNVFESRQGLNAAEVSIPVNHLQNGVYILQVTSGDQTGAKSFVIRH